MTKKKVFKFVANRSVKVKFNYDKGVPEEGNYGPQIRYGVVIDGEDQVLYASEALAEVIGGVLKRAGQELLITKNEELHEGKKKTHWSAIDLKDGEEKPKPAETSASIGKPQTSKEEPPVSKFDPKLVMKGCIKVVTEAFKDNNLDTKHENFPCVINTLFMEEARRR